MTADKVKNEARKAKAKAAEEEASRAPVIVEKKIPVVELYGPVIQGEGAICGHISYFLRTGGCPYKCSWCDSMHAVDPKQIKKWAQYLTPKQIVAKVQDLTTPSKTGLAPSHRWITFSGGDPLMWDLGYVAGALKLDGMKICVETQGTFAPYWLDSVDLITCSPKPPSSGMNGKVNYDIIQEYTNRHGSRTVLKIVIFDKDDLEFAQMVHQKFPLTPMYLSAGTPPPADILDDKDVARYILKRYRWLTEEVVNNEQLHNTIVGAQMHAMIYGHRTGV